MGNHANIFQNNSGGQGRSPPRDNWHGTSDQGAFFKSLQSLGFDQRAIERALEAALPGTLTPPKAPLSSRLEAGCMAAVTLMRGSSASLPVPRVTKSSQGGSFPHHGRGRISIAQLSALAAEEAWHFLQACAGSAGDNGSQETQSSIYALFCAARAAASSGRLSAIEYQWLLDCLSAGAFGGARLVIEGCSQTAGSRASAIVMADVSAVRAGQPAGPSRNARPSAADPTIPDMSELRESFMCPISRDIFVQPVTLGCGHSFELSLIEREASTRGQCPVCKSPIDSPDKLKVNIVLRDIVRRFFPNAIADGEPKPGMCLTVCSVF